LIIVLACLVAAPVVLVHDVAAQQKMTIEEYTRQLQDCQNRKRQADAGIADAEKQLAALRQESTALDGRIAAAMEEFYRACGCTQEEIDAFRRELQALLQEINGLLRLSPEELYEQLDRVAEIGARLDEMGRSKISRIRVRTLAWSRRFFSRDSLRN